MPAPKAAAAARRGPRRAAVGLLSLALLGLLLLGGGLGLVVLRNAPLVVPAWAEAQGLAQINRQIAPYRARLGEAAVVMEAGWVPRVLLRDVELLDGSGARIVSFESVSAGFALKPLLSAALHPTDLRIFGTRLAVRRDGAGAVWLSFDEELVAVGAGAGPDAPGAAQAAPEQGRGFGELMAQLDVWLQEESFSAFRRADVADVTLRYEDQRAGRNWTVDGGRAELVRSGADLRLRGDFALLTGGASAAGVELSFERKGSASEAALGLNLTDFPAQDLATQAAALSWLEALRAPISGALRFSMSETGALGPLSATLHIAEGVLQPNEAASPVPFTSARTYLTYDPQRQIVQFDEIALQSAWVSLRAEGQLGLVMQQDGWPEAFVGQLRLADISANPTDMLPEPVAFDSGFVDMRLSLAPFKVELGQLGLRDGATGFHVQGSIEALAAGWSYQIQAAAKALDLAQVLALWPERAGVKTRAWVAENVLEGHVSEAQFALRSEPDSPPEPLISFGFERVKLRFLEGLPPVENLSGQASLLRKRFAARASGGQLRAPQGGLLDIRGTEFIVPRTLPAPARGEVNLKASGQITALLSVAALAPINALATTELPATMADGRVALSGRLGWTMQPNPPPQALDYTLAAELTGVRSTVIVPGRLLTSPALQAKLTPQALEISGEALLDTIPLAGRFLAPLGPDAEPPAFEGQLELSPEFARRFALGLPEGSLSGRTSAQISLTLARDGQGPAFRLRSGLEGLGLSIAQIGWRHPQASAGKLSLAGRLGAEARVDEISLDASGLQATGEIRLTQGRFEAAHFSRVKIGSWLDVPLSFVARGADQAPRIEIKGGTLDLGRTSLGAGLAPPAHANQPGVNARQASPIVAQLDRLVISSGITLRGFRGSFQTRRGFEGSFTGSVNGAAPVRGQIVPQGGRSAFRIRSDNGGQVLKAAGLLTNASGGTLDLTMAPASSPGSYNGALKMREVRLKDAPAMAALLNAASVVGLLEQLGGAGILFGEVDARFQLTPRRAVISQASAVGASMGISMDGYYDLASGAMDMQGVVSPLFLVNGLGAIFTRKGEGLVGFNYTLRGTATEPSVQVNPLSIFTPGMFREIFRRPPPTIER
jgi:hypothetical protein